MSDVKGNLHHHHPPPTEERQGERLRGQRGVPVNLTWQERPNLSCQDLALHIVAIKMGIVMQAT